MGSSSTSRRQLDVEGRRATGTKLPPGRWPPAHRKFNWSNRRGNHAMTSHMPPVPPANRS